MHHTQLVSFPSEIAFSFAARSLLFMKALITCKYSNDAASLSVGIFEGNLLLQECSANPSKESLGVEPRRDRLVVSGKTHNRWAIESQGLAGI